MRFCNTESIKPMKVIANDDLSTSIEHRKIRLLVLAGLAASAYLFDWWLEPERLSNPLMVFFLLLAVLYCVVRTHCAWYIFCHCTRDEPTESPANLSVDVFVPAVDEPLWMVEQTLRAAREMQYPHQTYLLDDGGNYEFEQLAKNLGVHYLTRKSQDNHKAGNINNALTKTSGEIIAIFDVDHVPNREYLNEALWPFKDVEIGFVQVRLSHSNGSQSFVAGAAAARNEGFFGIPMYGMHGLGCAQKFGSNCLIRRTALDSIGGYKQGLAEDLHTSLFLHAKGWRSAYVSKPLAFGVEPTDLGGFFIQQYKWAHGTLTLLRQVYPRLVTRFDFPTNVCYTWRLTCFLAGPMVAFHILVTLVVLYSRDETLVGEFFSYLLHLAPLVLVSWLIMKVASKPFQPKTANLESRIPAPGLLLAFGTWPIYTKAFASVLMGGKPLFIATPKDKTFGGIKCILPQIFAVFLLLVAVVRSMLGTLELQTIGVCSFAGLLIIMHTGVFVAFRNEQTIKNADY
ncbi:cellulose synthase catalytic subunit [bacterium]|nr:cellulose synthase catalytic subunit [bacterium]